MGQQEGSLPKFAAAYAEEAIAALGVLASRELTEEEKVRVRELTALSYTDRRAVIVNSHSNRTTETTIGQVLSWGPGRTRVTEDGSRVPSPPVWTGHGTLFKPQDEFHSMTGDMLRMLGDERDVSKGKMFALIGSGVPLEDQSVKSLDLEQKTWKLLGVSYYGALGEPGFHFYNPTMGPAVAYNGQLVIGATIWGFEAFLGGNFWIGGQDELVHHVTQCLAACDGDDPRDEWGAFPFPDGVAGDTNAEDLWLSERTERVLVGACSNTWDCRSAVRSIVRHLTTAGMWALVLRGDPYTFCKFPCASDKVDAAMGGTFSDTSEKNMRKEHPVGLDALNLLWEGMSKWVCSPWLPADLPRRVAIMRRRYVVLADTDSTFLSLEPWLEHLGTLYDMSEATDEDRLTAVNCMIHLLCKLSAKQMWNLTTNLGVQEDQRSALLFKNEFVLERIILTDGKKHYAGLLTHQEGKKLGGGGKVEIKGLAMKKVNTAKATGEHFIRSIEVRALRSKEVDRAGMIRDVVDLERRIREAAALGSLEYSSPLVLGRLGDYANRYAMPVVRGMVTWNTAHPNEAIREGDRVNSFRMRVGSNAGILQDALDRWPEGSPERKILQDLRERFFGAGADEELSRNGLNWLCVPKGQLLVPAWARALIDVESAVQANISVMLPVLEAVGVKVLKNPGENSYSNVIAF
jgi:hypothetical protein